MLRGRLTLFAGMNQWRASGAAEDFSHQTAGVIETRTHDSTQPGG